MLIVSIRPRPNKKRRQARWPPPERGPLHPVAGNHDPLLPSAAGRWWKATVSAAGSASAGNDQQPGGVWPDYFTISSTRCLFSLRGPANLGDGRAGNFTALRQRTLPDPLMLRLTGRSESELAQSLNPLTPRRAGDDCHTTIDADDHIELKLITRDDLAGA
ncbi:hypothetical protein LNQ03_03365 [Klebsiella pneumoniae subsp. pneumoniae]|nr:hypothetical protein [Klebsiella pneumoniae subsp. pneumoniae]